MADGRYPRDGLVTLGIERLAHRDERRDAELLEHAQELALDQLDAGRHGCRRGLAARGLEGPIEVVENGQELAQERLVRVPRVVFPFACRALARVVELGGRAEIALALLLGFPGLGLEGLAKAHDLFLGPGGQIVVVWAQHLVAHDHSKYSRRPRGVRKRQAPWALSLGGTAPARRATASSTRGGPS